MRFSTLLLWVNATIIGASPLESRANHGQKDNLNDIEREFTGIYWKEAYDTCTDDEFDTLVKATKMSSLIMQYQTPYSGSSTTDGAISAVYDSAAWNRYFLAPEAAQSNDLKYSWALNSAVYQTVLHNMEQARDYPRKGGFGKSGRLLPSKQVRYTCKDIIGTCATAKNKYGKWTGPTATTMQPNYVANTEGVPMIQFCPRFFQEKEQRHIEDVVNDYKKANKKMSPGSLPSLRTYEHALMHEWMHCNVFGFLPYNKDTSMTEAIIIDVKVSGLKGVPDSVIMYGDYYAYKFARKYDDDSKDGAANLQTAINADSYALFYVYSYLHAEFSWDTDGSEDLAKRDVAEAWTVNDDNYGNSREATDINDFTDPNNCYFDGLTSTLNVTCVFDPDYTDTATEQPDHSDYQCDTTRTSGLPATIFGDMYGDFCNEADGKARTWLVDYKGNKRSRLARGFDKRTPPANPSDYKSALGYLSFEKKDGDAKCSKSCSDAFRYLKAGPCGTTGQGMYSMTLEGSLDVGCGIYQFSVSKMNQ